MNDSIFKNKGVLPKKRANPNNKQLKGAQGHINVSTDDIINANYGEVMEDYRYGQNGSYFHGEGRTVRRMVAESQDFRESELADTVSFKEGYTGPVALPKEARNLWHMIRHQAGGMLTDGQKKALQDFVLGSEAYWEVANKLTEIRNKQVPNRYDAAEKMRLESAMAMIVTDMTRTLRSE